MKMTAPGRKLLMEREGCKLKAYKDSVGVLTIGVGHTSAAGPPPVRAGMTITKTQAEHIFEDDLRDFEEGVEFLLAGAPIEPHQFDSLTSISYNIGLGAFAGSTMLREFLKGDLEAAAKGILLWNKPSEIRSRRRGEHQQFLGIQMVARA